MSEDELPEQLTVAELLARYGGDLPARPRRRRAAPEIDEATETLDASGSIRHVSESPRQESDRQTVPESGNDPLPESGDALRFEPEPGPERALEPQPTREAKSDLTSQHAPNQGSDPQTDRALATTGEPVPQPGSDSAADEEPAALQDPDSELAAEQESSAESALAEQESSTGSVRAEQGSSAESAPAEQESGLGAARRKKSLWQRRGSIRALMIVAIVAALVAAYYVVILFVAQSQIARAEVLRPNSAEVIDEAAQQNVDNYLLVMGDQSGADAGAQITALAHVSADGASLVIVSFPRQTIIDVPPCGTKASPVPPFTGTLEQAFAEGGPRCSIAAVQEATGIRINHYIGIDLQRFGQVVDSVGGLTLCLREPLKDSNLNLSLPAGQSTLDGADATNYVRAVNADSGSDPQRANRQVDFLTKLFDKVLSTQTVLNPVRLTKLAFATARAMTLDPDTSLGQLRGLGELFASGTAKVTIVVPPMSGMLISVPGSSVMGTRIDDVNGRNLFDSIIANQKLPSTAAEDPATNDSTQDTSTGSSTAAAPQSASDLPPSPSVC